MYLRYPRFTHGDISTCAFRISVDNVVDDVVDDDVVASAVLFEVFTDFSLSVKSLH
jgi:hypothetical protein